MSTLSRASSSPARRTSPRRDHGCVRGGGGTARTRNDRASRGRPDRCRLEPDDRYDRVGVVVRRGGIAIDAPGPAHRRADDGDIHRADGVWRAVGSCHGAELRAAVISGHCLRRPSSPGVLLPRGGQLLLRRPDEPGGRQHRGPRGHDQQRDHLRRAPHRGRRALLGRLRRHGGPQRARAAGRRATRSREPAARHQRLRRRAPRQWPLEPVARP